MKSSSGMTRQADRSNLAPGVNALAAVKLLHTAVWALFAASIVALPITAVMRRFDWALALTALVLVECGVLAVNRGRCPLTGLAARYTSDRTDNFDIYLPKMIARYNKVIFGLLFLFGEGVVLWRWLV
jgi:hypothetical protein